METITVVFDDVLHVQRISSSKTEPPHTIFSFMSDFKYTPYVKVPGMPRLEPGMRVRAILREPGDWKTLIGWKDLDTGVVVAPTPRWHFYRLVFLCGWVLLTLCIGVPLIHDQDPSTALTLGAMLAFGLIFFALEFRNYRRAGAESTAIARCLTIDA